MEAIEKKTNPFVRAGRWIKNIFTRKTVVDTVIIAHKRGQLRMKRRVLKERAKIAYYRTRNVVRNVTTAVNTTFNRVVERIITSKAWPAVRSGFNIAGEAIRGIVTITALSVGFILTTTAVVEGVVYMSLFMGEALAASTAFVTLYLLAYYAGHWVMRILAERKIDKMLESVVVDDADELADGTNLKLAHA